MEGGGLPQNDYIRASLLECVKVIPSSAGYLTLTTPLVGCQEAIFEPCQGNVQVRILCPGIIRLHPVADENKSIFTVQYINVEDEGIELETEKTMGAVQPCKPCSYTTQQLPTVASVTQRRERKVTQKEKLKRLYEMVDNKLSPNTEENTILKTLIKKYQDVFATEEDPLTVTPYYMHTIRQMDDEVVYKRPYPIPVSHHEKVREELKRMQEERIIIPSHSAYNSPLIPVLKKDGGIRLCLDFRALNLKLRADRYPLPSIPNILNQLGKSKLFSCLDMKQGYHQIPLDPESMEKTSFSSPEGHWMFTSLPFGLKDAPSSFQRVVNTVLAGLIGTKAHVYLDDIVVQGTDLQQSGKKGTA